jgi:hypothetical protein
MYKVIGKLDLEKFLQYQEQAHIHNTKYYERKIDQKELENLVLQQKYLGQMVLEKKKHITQMNDSYKQFEKSAVEWRKNFFGDLGIDWNDDIIVDRDTREIRDLSPVAEEMAAAEESAS